MTPQQLRKLGYTDEADAREEALNRAERARIARDHAQRNPDEIPFTLYPKGEAE